MPLVLHNEDKMLMIIVVQKQYRSSRSCSKRQMLPKIPQNPRKKTPGPESLLKTLFKRNPTAAAFSANPSKPLRTFLCDITFVGLKFSSDQIFVTLGKFRHLGPKNNLGRRKFGLFLKVHTGVKFVFEYDISSFQLVNSHYIL